MIRSQDTIGTYYGIHTRMFGGDVLAIHQDPRAYYDI